MPPEMTTAVMPTARIPFSATCRRMSVRFPMSRKTGRPPRTGENTIESSEHGREAEERRCSRASRRRAAAASPGARPPGGPPGLSPIGRSRRVPAAAARMRSSVASACEQLGRDAALAEHDARGGTASGSRTSRRSTARSRTPRRRAGAAARRSSAFAARSMPRVGSSSSSTDGDAKRQRARIAFCWLPPESVAIGTSRRRRAHARVAHERAPRPPARRARVDPARARAHLLERAERDVLGRRRGPGRSPATCAPPAGARGRRRARRRGSAGA